MRKGMRRMPKSAARRGTRNNGSSRSVAESASTPGHWKRAWGGVDVAADPESPVPIAASRRRAVKRILKQWRSQLIDVSAGNRLLYYKDLKVAVVDLSGATVGGVEELLDGRPVRAGRLWSDTLSLAAAVRSLKAIAKPARVYAEEFGLQITF